jgi:phage terminase Nu1 subunit (DNA packaging protein)
MTPRRRKTDNQPTRESFLEELCNRQHSELQRMREENFRLRRVAQWIQQSEATRPAGQMALEALDSVAGKGKLCNTAITALTTALKGTP